jgi:hypothetical protein
MPIQTSAVTTSGNVVYTSTGSTALTFLSICNYGGSDVLANVHVVPNGGTASNDNLIITQLELVASGNGTGDTYQLYSGGEKLLLDNGDFVYIDASANTVTAVTSYISV